MTHCSAKGFGMLPGIFLAALLPLSGATKGTLAIGNLTNITGVQAYIGPGEVPGLEDEVAKVNASGGINGWLLKLISYDCASNVAECLPVAKRLIDQDHVVALIGPPYSGGCISIADTADKLHVPLITNTATNLNVTVDQSGKVHPYMFRACFIDPYQGTALADYCYTKLGKRRAALITDVASPYTVGLHQFFQARFEKLGGKVVMSEGYNGGDQEFRAQVAKVKSSKADVLLACADNYKDPGLIAKQAKALGLRIQMVGGDAWMVKDLLAFAGKEMDGAIFTALASTEDPVFAKYNTEYKQKHPGKEPNAWGYMSMDALKIIENAIRVVTANDGAWSQEKFRDAIENTRNLPVFTTNKFTFDKATHNPYNRAALLIQIKDSQFKVLGSFTPQE